MLHAVAHIGQAELLTPKPDESMRFFVDVLGMEIEARFIFNLPLLRTGPYALAAAVASGTIDNHVQHHWVHEALVFEVKSPIEKGVLVGLPMEIEMRALSNDVSSAS